MKKMFTSAALGFALGTLSLSPAIAQSPSQNMPKMGMMGGGCPMMRMMGRGMMHQGQMGPGMMRGGKMGQGMMRGPARMGAMVEGRLAYLKAALKITDTQEAVWKGYADAVRGRVAVMQGMRQTMMEAMQKGNATERMDVRIKGLEAMVATMKAIKPATEKLHAVLTDEQKNVADHLIGMHCGAM